MYLKREREAVTNLLYLHRSGVPFIGKYVGTEPDIPVWSSPDSCSQTSVTDTIEQFVCASGGKTLVELTLGSSSSNYT